MRLIIASNNAHKVKEIKEILGGYFSDIQTLREAGLDIDVVEDGVTFEENALKKATQVLAAAPWADAALSADCGDCRRGQGRQADRGRSQGHRHCPRGPVALCRRRRP